ncbi:Endo-1,4-beta-xylanase, GH35 family [Mycolicibacterium fluoranthenivorans]|jgi:hypothetical protein|uniref:Endo-1,4-beta-xylanase, GH35 family n=2 Tax=Mycolicibacterium fluoranthenivorans TaxID=258505 RepID=A0A1G4VWE1_9MYCO|nr:Endo-1,4-beta-xylanase, GH35 family [Mycolicibacterium fluoranthenivorans]
MRFMLRTLGHTARRAVLIAALVASFVSVGPAVSHAGVVAPADGYGFGQGAAPTYEPFEDTNRELDAVARTGASWYRVAVDWSTIEKTRGQYNWAYLDNAVNTATAKGLRVLGVLLYTPPWARPQALNSLLPSVPPADASQFADFASKAVQRYAGRIQAWQVWNEPNLPLFMGFTQNRAAVYAGMLKAAYPAIKAANPGATVVMSGLSRQPGPESPSNFLKQLYAAGVQGSFDAAAAHPYVTPGGIAADPEGGWSEVGLMHDVMTGAGDGGKKIWFTELGAPTSDTAEGVSQQEQAKQITDVLAAAAGLGYVGPAFIYSIRDNDSSNRGDREANFGALLTTDWQPKFTASVLAR